MGRNKCVYLHCTSIGKPMFRFPINDKNRLNEWVINSGNPELAHLPADNLYVKHICIDHFDPLFITNVSGKRKRLTKFAVPKSYQDSSSDILVPMPQDPVSPTLKVLTPTKIYGKKHTVISPICQESPSCYSENIITTPLSRKRRCEFTEDTPKCKKLRLELKMANLALKKEQRKLRLIKSKFTGKNVVNLNTYQFKSESSKVLTTMQFKNNKRRWNEEERKFCTSLYYKSSGTYKHLLKCGIVLAAPSTIRYWLRETNCFPGLSDQVLKNIALKYEGKTIMERSCSICFDEMSIMSHLEYSKKFDLVEGFEDFGDERGNSVAKNALVFIARGIYSNWKLPLAYFLVGKNFNSKILADLIKSIINKVFECGLLPKSITCDQGTTNVATMKMLGVTVDEPFFFVNGRKIYSVFDVPHIIKNLRNNLLTGNFQYDDNEVSFKDIVDTYNIDSKNKSKTLNKLTPTHLNPNNFQKMKVKYATQIFSNSVSAAIKTAVQSGELKSKTASCTAKFIKSINNLFDSLNSKKKLARNPFRCAITKNRKTLANKTLVRGKILFRKLKKISYNKNGEKKYTRPPSFDGMVQTINAITQLSKEELSKKVDFIMTYRFNQDVIENLFGIYRIKGGCNRNPTARTLRAMFRSQLVNNLLQLTTTNCEADDECFIVETKLDDPEIPHSAPSSSGSAGNVSTTTTETIINMNEGEGTTVIVPDVDVTLESCSITYFAGWIGKKCTENFNCKNCRETLLMENINLDDKKQLFIINKTYSNITEPSLKSPTELLFKITDAALTIFEENIKDMVHAKNLVSRLMEIFKAKTKVEKFHDYCHLDYIISKIFEVKIFHYCKMWKKSLSAPSKIRILQNK